MLVFEWNPISISISILISIRLLSLSLFANVVWSIIWIQFGISFALVKNPENGETAARVELDNYPLEAVCDSNLRQLTK